MKPSCPNYENHKKLAKLLEESLRLNFKAANNWQKLWRKSVSISIGKNFGGNLSQFKSSYLNFQTQIIGKHFGGNLSQFPDANNWNYYRKKAYVSILKQLSRCKQLAKILEEICLNLKAAISISRRK